MFATKITWKTPKKYLEADLLMCQLLIGYWPRFVEFFVSHFWHEKNHPQARMKDGQHLNDSLIDLFVSMLVSHPHVLGITGWSAGRATFHWQHHAAWDRITRNFSLKFLRFFGVAYCHVFSFDMYDHVCIWLGTAFFLARQERWKDEDDWRW